jgi:hypothetical protein
MRLLTAAALLAAVASHAAAGPIDSLQYRTTLATDRPVTPWPAPRPGETAYLLGDSPAFGVVVSNSADWSPAYPVHPGASFSAIGTGGFTPFTAAESVDSLELSGGGRYALDVELRDSAGRVGVVTFTGQFEAGWWGGQGFAWLISDTIDLGTGGAPRMPVPPSGSVWLGRTRYDVRLEEGWPPSYRQNEDGSWQQVWHPADPVPFRDEGYWTEGSGNFYATITPVQTPEPCTLVLAGVGVCGVWASRRRRCR